MIRELENTRELSLRRDYGNYALKIVPISQCVEDELDGKQTRKSSTIDKRFHAMDKHLNFSLNT